METGFTEACAVTWSYNTKQTRQECPICVSHALQQRANNLEPPTCYLATCIQCDEDVSGAIFAEFAGLTRRRAGLLSGIARNCTEVSRLVVRDPCVDLSHSPSDSPTMTPPTESPTESPTMAPTDASSQVTVPFLLSSTFLSTVFYLFA